MPRRALPADAELAPIGWAAEALVVTTNAIKKRILGSGTLRGAEPRSAANPSHQWMVSVHDVLALCAEKGLPAPAVPTRLVEVATAATTAEDALAGYELAREAELVAKQDRDRTALAAVERERDDLRMLLKERDAEIRRLRGAVRSLVDEPAPDGPPPPRRGDVLGP